MLALQPKPPCPGVFGPSDPELPKFWGTPGRGRKLLVKIPNFKKHNKAQNCASLGLWRYLWGIFHVTLVRLFGHLGPESAETPANGGPGRNASFSCVYHVSSPQHVDQQLNAALSPLCLA